MNRLAVILALTAPLVCSPPWTESLGGEPPAADVTQNAILEAARQDLIQQRLNQLTARFEALLLDMESNAVQDPARRTGLQELGDRIGGVNAGPVTKASELLRDAAYNPGNRRAALDTAVGHIDHAARELGSLVLKLGVIHATEVFGRELHEIVGRQQALHGRSLDRLDRTEKTAPPLWKAQAELADWLNRLLRETADVKDYSTDALAVVRLSRAVKHLREHAVETLLHAASLALREERFAEAVEKQKKALRALLRAELDIRHGAELDTLKRIRDRLKEVLKGQKALRLETARLSREQFVEARAVIQGRQHGVLRALEKTSVPPPPEWVAAPPLAVGQVRDTEPPDLLVEQARGAMRGAEKTITAGKNAETGTLQVKAEAALRDALRKVEERIDQLLHLDNLFRRLQAAKRRLRIICGLQDQQQHLVDDTQDAADRREDCAYLAASQGQLAFEVREFCSSLHKENRALPQPNPYIDLLRSPLKRADESMMQATPPLKDNQHAPALAAEQKALKALGHARETAELEVAALQRQWDMLQAVRDLTQLVRHLKEIEAEQRDLRIKTETSHGAGTAVTALSPRQRTLSRAVEEVSTILAGVLSAPAAQSALDQAKGAMTGAAGKLEKNKAEPAIPLQKQAEAALVSAQEILMRLMDQQTYISELADLLRNLLVEAAKLLERQILLRLETQPAPLKAFPELAGEQDILLGEAKIYAEMFPIGQKQYEIAAKEMAGAIGFLNKKDRPQTLRHMALAEEALRRAIKELLAALEALDQIPLAGRPGQSVLIEPELTLLIRVILLASDQRKLRYQTRATARKEVGRFVPDQRDLERRATELVGESGMDPLLYEAGSQMAQATKKLQALARGEAIVHQQKAEKALREFILRLVLAAFQMPESLAEGAFGMTGVPMSSVLPQFGMSQSLHMFAKTAVKGEIEKDRERKWTVLGRRERATLNENFARELPLEYRAILKEYYEKLSQ